jgi:ATP-dependent Clp protease adaptor protein ClpS
MPEKDTSSPPSADQEKPGTQTAEPPKAAPKKSAKPRRKTKQLPPFNVVLLDDDDHTYEYVIEMLGKVFGYAKERAFKLAEEVDGSGRVIVLTTHKELAELKRDQILAYGRDSRISACRGSMTAIIEPAEG